MRHDPYKAPKSRLSGETRRIRIRWRVCLALGSLTVIALIYLGHQIAWAINEHYFKASGPPLGVPEFVTTLVAVYLLLVSISGRWRLISR